MKMKYGYVLKVVFSFGVVYLFGLSFRVCAQSLPTAEEFHNLLMGCAMGAKVEVKADLIGSIVEIYRGQRTQGAASFRSETEFLKLLPEKDRLEAYRLYTECIGKFLKQQPTQKKSFKVLNNAGGILTLVVKVPNVDAAIKPENKVCLVIAGTKIEILETKDDVLFPWAKVRILEGEHAGKIGWVSQNVIQTVHQ